MDAYYAVILERLKFLTLQIVISVLIGIAAIYLAFWYSTRQHGYWKGKGLPYVKPLPVFGTLLTGLKKTLHEADFAIYQKHGRLYGAYEGNDPVLYVAEPDLLRDILVKDFHFFQNHRLIVSGNELFDSMVSNLHGEDWKRVRTLITPTFSTGKIKRMANILNDCAQTLTNNFRAIAERGESLDSKRMYGAYTMDVIASTAFSTKIDSHNDPDNDFVTHAKQVFTRGNKWMLILLFLFPSIFRFFQIGIFPVKSMEFFRSVTLQIIEHRKKTGETRNDFLQLLLDTSTELADECKLDSTERANDNIAVNYGKDESPQVFKAPVQHKSLSYLEVVSQCVAFFIGGYETTATTLALASYELAVNQDIQEKLINELDEVLRKTDGEFTYEALQSMKYMDNVISETLRKYPPIIRTERLPNADYELKGTGMTIPKGMVVNIPVYAMHHDPKNYPDPEKFDPDRFSVAERAKRNPYVYLPFGAGPRNCLAMRFALMEIKICLAHVLTHFRIKRCSETKVPVEFHYGRGLLQPKEIKIKMEIREDNIVNL